MKSPTLALVIVVLALLVAQPVLASSFSSYISVRVGSDYYKPSISSITASGSGVYVSGTVSAEGGVWSFVSKEYFNGSFAWTRVFRLEGDTYVTSEALANNTLYLAGVCMYGSRVSLMTKLFILALNASTGEVLWCREYSFNGHVGSAALCYAKNSLVVASSYTNGFEEGLLVMKTSLTGDPVKAFALQIKIMDPAWSSGVAGFKPQEATLLHNTIFITGYIARLYHTSTGETIVPNGTFTIALRESKGFFTVEWVSIVQAGEAVASSSLYEANHTLYVTGGLMRNVSGLTRNTGVEGIILEYNESSGELMDALGVSSDSGNTIIVYSGSNAERGVVVGCSISYNMSLLRGFMGLARVFYAELEKPLAGLCINARVAGLFNQSGYSSAIKAFVYNKTITLAAGSYILVSSNSLSSIRLCLNKTSVTVVKAGASAYRVNCVTGEPKFKIESSSIKLVGREVAPGGFSVKSLIISAVTASVVIAVLVYILARIIGGSSR